MQHLMAVNSKQLMRSTAEAAWSNNDRSLSIAGLFDGKCMLMFLHCWSSMAAKWLFQQRLRCMNTKHRNTRRDLVACTVDLQDWSYDRTRSKGTKKKQQQQITQASRGYSSTASAIKLQKRCKRNSNSWSPIRDWKGLLNQNFNWISMNHFI